LLALLKGVAVEVEGFHVFAGSQNLRGEIIAEAQTRTVDLIVELAASPPDPLRYLNLGGGFGIPYIEQDQRLDLGAVAANLHWLAEEVIAVRFPGARAVIELGRYIVGECGVYVTEIVDRTVSRGRCYLVVDGGLHHQLAASGNFGQVIRRNYPSPWAPGPTSLRAGRSPSSASCALRSTCSATRCHSLKPRSEISW
jgi:diaminopimelate decarboxylase